MKFRRYAARPVAFALFAASCVLFAAPSAIGQSTVDHSAVASGGGTVSAGQFRLHSTIGEPAAGTVSGGNFVLYSGFQAKFVGLGDPAPVDPHIFYDGFEGND